MRARIRPFLASAAVLLCVNTAAAQGSPPDLRTEATVGSEAERYLRMLQVAGKAPLYPWTARGYSPAEVDRLVPEDTDHPWAARLLPADSIHPHPLRLVRPRLELDFNSAFPQGTNDGPVWTGRGLTAVGSAGVQLRYGPLSIRLEPLVFWSQNRGFEFVDNGRPDTAQHRDPRSPNNIDFPQRFGDGSFIRVDPGQSTARLDWRGFALGVSTANQGWGPAIDQPLLLGNNAAGFAHGFVGTASPWKIGIGRLYGRIMWGSLYQSQHSIMKADSFGSRRFVSGITGVFLPYGLDGLEIGISRFYHQPWPEPRLPLHWLQRPLETFLRNNLRHPDEARINQIASFHARWVLPAAGFEAYGEFAREDHSYDLLDLIIEPDRSSGYMLGARKVWGSGMRRWSLRGEWVNTQPGHLEQSSNQSTNLYRHTDMRQGHTVGGQLLGSLAGYGGGGNVLALERYTPAGRWSVDLTRTRLSSPRVIRNVAYGHNVINSIGGEAVWFRGGMDLVARLRGSVEMNRFPGEDVFNLSAQLGGRIGF